MTSSYHFFYSFLSLQLRMELGLIDFGTIFLPFIFVNYFLIIFIYSSCLYTPVRVMLINDGKIYHSLIIFLNLFIRNIQYFNSTREDMQSIHQCHKCRRDRKMENTQNSIIYLFPGCHQMPSPLLDYSNMYGFSK